MEELGYVDPLSKKKSFEKERVLYWIKMGAQPTATVHNLLVSEKIIDAPKIKKFSVSKKAKTEAVKAAEAVAAASAAPAPAPQAPTDEPKEEPQK